MFSQINFFTWSRHFKELKLKGNLFLCLRIWTVVSLTYEQQNCVCEFFLSKYFFSESDFCTITPHFFDPITKMFCNFSLRLNMAKRRHVFLALWVRKLRSKLNKQKVKFALTCNFQKVNRTLTFRGLEKFNNSLYSKTPGIV